MREIFQTNPYEVYEMKFCIETPEGKSIYLKDDITFSFRRLSHQSVVPWLPPSRRVSRTGFQKPRLVVADDDLRGGHSEFSLDRIPFRRTRIHEVFVCHECTCGHGDDPDDGTPSDRRHRWRDVHRCEFSRGSADCRIWWRLFCSTCRWTPSLDVFVTHGLCDELGSRTMVFQAVEEIVLESGTAADSHRWEELELGWLECLEMELERSLGSR